MTNMEIITRAENIIHDEELWSALSSDDVATISSALLIDRVRERTANKDNSPLKLEELRETSNTDWVWVVFPGLDKSENCWYRAKKLFDLYSHEHYGKTWIAYRRPPEGDDG